MRCEKGGGRTGLRSSSVSYSTGATDEHAALSWHAGTRSVVWRTGARRARARLCGRRRFECGAEWPRGDGLAIQPAPDGGFYACDGNDVSIRRYDAAGTFVRHVGRKGAGPGEYNLRA